jgi:hypothetical protein
MKPTKITTLKKEFTGRYVNPMPSSPFTLHNLTWEQGGHAQNLPQKQDMKYEEIPDHKQNG